MLTAWVPFEVSSTSAMLHKTPTAPALMPQMVPWMLQPPWKSGSLSSSPVVCLSTGFQVDPLTRLSLPLLAPLRASFGKREEGQNTCSGNRWSSGRGMCCMFRLWDPSRKIETELLGTPLECNAKHLPFTLHIQGSHWWLVVLFGVSKIYPEGPAEMIGARNRPPSSWRGLALPFAYPSSLFPSLLMKTSFYPGHCGFSVLMSLAFLLAWQHLAGSLCLGPPD